MDLLLRAGPAGERELDSMRRRDASINDVKIDESERRYRSPQPSGTFSSIRRRMKRPLSRKPSER